jgi:Lon protease-like protein
MIHLPLFPLNTVLFPGMPLSLHIFEERYKKMIGACIDERQPFGVVLIESGQEAYGSAHPYKVGCTAQITQVQPLAEGRLNIVAVGQERFEIAGLDYSETYLTADVELLPLVTQDAVTLESASHELKPWVDRYVEALGRSDNLEIDTQQFPTEPLALTYLAAYLLQIPMEQKQDLLAAPDALTMIHETHTLYRREVALLAAMLARSAAEEDGPFSLN